MARRWDSCVSTRTHPAMRALTPIALFVRFTAVAVGLAALLTACGDAPEALNASSDAVGVVDEVAEPYAVEPSTEGPTQMEPEAEAGQLASAPAVTPEPEPRPSEAVSVPLPERPPMRAPESKPSREVRPAQTPAPRNTAAADAFWQSFQRAVRSRDRAAIARGLADQVRVGDQTFAKSSEQVQAVLDAIVEEEAARDAYLAVDGLTHGPNGSTFETTAHYEIEGEPYEVEVFGRIAEVAPGDWRLVEVGNR